MTLPFLRCQSLSGAYTPKRSSMSALIPLRLFSIGTVFLLGLVHLSAADVPTPVAAAPVAKVHTTTKPDPFSDPQIAMISIRHEKAVGGDEKETKALATDLEKLTHDHPENHLFQAFLGSTYTLRSRDAFPGPSKYTFLKDGIESLDAAVTADAANPGVRLIRALNYYNLPSIFGRRSIAHDDFRQLLRWVNGVDKCDYQFNKDTAQLIYYYAGLCLLQESASQDAREALTRGWKIDPASPLAVKIHTELEKMADDHVL